MTTFVGNDPEACRKEACPETVQRPESESSKRIEVRMRKGNSGGIDKRVKVSCSLVDAPNYEEIPKTKKGMGNEPRVLYVWKRKERTCRPTTSKQNAGNSVC